ncbi:MAG TPA: hypothetical protein VMV86_05005 [Methanosarcinales archaeon]|nr:hypothetical protein [Methanosarcinales archaeon]
MKIIRLIPKIANTNKNTEAPSNNDKEAEGVATASPSNIYSDNAAIQGHKDESIAPSQLKKRKKKKKIPGFFPRNMPYSGNKS